MISVHPNSLRMLVSFCHDTVQQDRSVLRKVLDDYAPGVDFHAYFDEIDALAEYRYGVHGFSALLSWDGEREHTIIYSLSGVVCWLRNSLQHSASKRRWVTSFADHPVLVNESLFELAMDANCNTFHHIIDSIVEFSCDSAALEHSHDLRREVWELNR